MGWFKGYVVACLSSCTCSTRGGLKRGSEIRLETSQYLTIVGEEIDYIFSHDEALRIH